MSSHTPIIGTNDDSGSLGERSLHSVAFTGSAQVIKIISQIVSLGVLSRLIEPEDFGLVAMVTVFTGLAVTFLEGGLSIATIQRSSITHEQVSNLYWVNIALGVCLCGAYVAISPLVARVYGEPELTGVMSALSVFFVIAAVSVQHDALLKRAMRFKLLAILDVTAMVGSVAIALALAWYGIGYWALVVQQIARIAILTLLRWSLTGWFPGRPTRGSGVRPMLAFGANLTGANFVGYFASNVAPFAVGIAAGASSLGLFDRAFRLASIPSKQLLPPVFSVFQSALARMADDERRLRSAIVSLTKKIALAMTFVTMLMVIGGDWFIAVMLGEDWSDAVLVFRLLATATVVTPITSLVAISLVAAGCAPALLRWKSITLLIMILSVLVGLPWGMTGIVAAHAAGGLCIRMPMFLWYSTRYLPLEFRDYVRAVGPPVLVAAVVSPTLIIGRYLYEPQSALVGLTGLGLLGAILYIAGASLLRSTRHELLEMVEMSGSIISRSRR